MQRADHHQRVPEGSGSLETRRVEGGRSAVVPSAVADGSEGGLRFADPPVVANLLKVFEGGFIPARGAVELLLNEGRTAQDEEREAGVRDAHRHTVAELAQATHSPH